EPGAATNAVTVKNTPNNAAQPLTEIDLGTAVADVSVEKTTGSLTIDGQLGKAGVHIAGPFPLTPLTGLIKGKVFITGKAELTIDDSGDTNKKSATFSVNGADTIL